jgi:hypothetical protein
MTVLRSFDELLKRRGGGGHPFALFAGATCCYVLYGLASGFFQGGWSLALALWKVPLILVASLTLCLPSLYVFSSLAGVELSPQAFLRVVAEFAGITGLILLALMPVIWLFSVSTLSLTFVVWLHLMIWIIALAFARQFLARSVGQAPGTISLWLALLFVVSLQMTTYVRPVLWRGAGQPLFASAKRSFFGHFGEVIAWETKRP